MKLFSWIRTRASDLTSGYMHNISSFSVIFSNCAFVNWIFETSLYETNDWLICHVLYLEWSSFRGAVGKRGTSWIWTFVYLVLSNMSLEYDIPIVSNIILRLLWLFSNKSSYRIKNVLVLFFMFRSLMNNRSVLIYSSMECWWSISFLKRLFNEENTNNGLRIIKILMYDLYKGSS